MNKQNKIEEQVMIDHLFKEMKIFIAQREIDIFRMQNEKSYSEGKDSEFISFLNESVYARPFIRFVLLQTLQNKWVTISEVITKIKCNDKTARNLYQKAMDYDMIYRQPGNIKLCFQSTPRSMKIYDNYVKALYFSQGDLMADHLIDLLQYMKLTRKHGTQYQVERE